MRADTKTFQEIEADENALGQAVVVIVIAAIASLIGNIFRNGIAAGMVGLVASLIGYAVWTVMVVLIGTKLLPEPTTKASFSEGFRVIGFTASPGVFSVLAIIPFLGVVIQFLISIWMLVIGVVAVKEVLDYSSIGRALAVCGIAFVIYFVLWFMLIVPLMLARAITM